MSSVINISELYNVVTSAAGVGMDNATLQTNLLNIQKMVEFDTKTILANTISGYDSSPIFVKDAISFLNSIQVLGTITQNGVAVTNGKPAGDTAEIQYNNAGTFASNPNLTFDGTSLVNPSLKAPSETLLQIVASTASTIMIQTDVANNIVLTLATPITNLSFTGVSATGLYRLRLIIQQDATGSRTITWPTSVKWGTAGPPLLSVAPSATDIIELITVNTGFVWFAHTIGLGF